jgi:hypothetical protein
MNNMLTYQPELYSELSMYDSFMEVAKKAKIFATQKSALVHFEHNGVTCYVNSNTRLNILYHDYWSQYQLVRCYKELDELRTLVYGERYKNLYKQPPKPATAVTN